MEHSSHSESHAGLGSGPARQALPLAWDDQLQQRFLMAVIKCGGPAEATPAVVSPQECTSIGAAWGRPAPRFCPVNAAQLNGGRAGPAPTKSGRL